MNRTTPFGMIVVAGLAFGLFAPMTAEAVCQFNADVYAKCMLAPPISGVEISSYARCQTNLTNDQLVPYLRCTVGV